MARLPHARPILEAAARWRDRCLIDDGSVFTDEKLWTAENFAALHRHFIDRPDNEGKSFLDKFEIQMQAPPPPP